MPRGNGGVIEMSDDEGPDEALAEEVLQEAPAGLAPSADPSSRSPGGGMEGRDEDMTGGESGEG